MQRSLAVTLAAILVAAALHSDVASAQGLQAVYSRDGTDVWAVGDAGLVHRSFDGGATWTAQNIGATTLRGVAAQGFVVIVVGDGGEVRRSTDSGGSWSLQTLPGSPNLRAVEMLDASAGWIAGDGGAIFATADGGANWTQQTSGTVQRLNAVRFRDASSGWAVGAGGTVLHTTDGGANWTSVDAGTTKMLRAVDHVGSTVWVVGHDATAVASTNDGVNWDPIDLRMDGKSDVTGVWLESATAVRLAGGGGFLRRSTDGGTSWVYQKNPVLAETSDFHFTNGGTKGWATHTRTKAVLRTTDGGATWSYTGSGTRSWSLKQSVVSGSVRGNTVCINSQNKNSIYVVLGMQVYKSTNRGENWSLLGTITGGGSKTNAFYVSPSDSMLLVAATGAPDRVTRSTDGGATWTTTKTVDFTEYGVPLEMDVDKPTDLYFGPEDGKMWHSPDFGATWSELSNPGFRSPCDIVVVPGTSSGTIWVGDGITGSGNGQMFRSTNGGTSFTLIYTGAGSEIPMIAAAKLNPGIGLSTHWGSGGVRRTTDFGLNWTQVHTAGSAWGCDFARDDPTVCVFGVYSGGTSYLSLDSGASGTWTTTSLTGSNYAFYAVDRATIFALQGGGVYKMVNTYTVPTSNTQSVTLTGPNGGETWTAGEARNITWTASNVALARIEWRPNGSAPWTAVAEVAGYAGNYTWTVPIVATTQAEVRVSDAWDASPIDGSNAPFTILAPVAAAAPAALDFGSHGVGSSTTDSVQVSNNGTAALDATVAVAGNGFVLEGPSGFTLAPSASQWVRTRFEPAAVQTYAGTFTVSGNIAAPVVVALAGEGTQTAALSLDVPDGGEVWQYNSAHDIQWSAAVVANVRLEYQTQPSGPWALVADNVPASPPSYAWTIPNDPTTTARVRVSEVGGALVDESAADFSITVPVFAAKADTLDLGLVNVGGLASRTLTISNPGTAPLAISSVSDDSPEFHAGRTSLVVPPLGTDTLGVYYSPDALGSDTAQFTLTADDPASPHTVVALGAGAQTSDAGQAPAVFALDARGPNPFRGETVIRYQLPQSARVQLEVFDLQGRRVATLVRGEQEPGVYAVPFGSGVAAAGGRVGDLAAGVYFVRLQAGSFSRTAKLVLAR